MGGDMLSHEVVIRRGGIDENRKNVRVCDGLFWLGDRWGKKWAGGPSEVEKKIMVVE